MTRSRPKTQAVPSSTTGAVQGAASISGPCKLTPVQGQSNAFQAKASDMPTDFLLSTPTGSTGHLSVEVRQGSDLGKVVPGQPTALSASAFTLNLKADSYVVIIGVGCLPSAKPVWIVEALSGSHQARLDCSAGQTQVVSFALNVGQHMNRKNIQLAQGCCNGTSSYALLKPTISGPDPAPRVQIHPRQLSRSRGPQSYPAVGRFRRYWRWSYMLLATCRKKCSIRAFRFEKCVSGSKARRHTSEGSANWRRRNDQCGYQAAYAFLSCY